ncbi:MAG TPA: hypothetical protein VMU50_11940 [Polyangia bacterium]|nr:hypothetical protein [Polyangia bacterium]
MRLIAWKRLLTLGLVLAFQAGCGSDCCEVDGFPVVMARGGLGPLAEAAPGALLVGAREDRDGAAAFRMLLDTGTPITVLAGDTSGTLAVQSRSFRLLDANAAGATRGLFRGITALQLPLHAAGTEDTTVGGVFGGDLLSGYSVDLRLGAPCVVPGDGGVAAAATGACPTVTFWNYQGANDGALSDAGFAVLPFAAYGGGEVSAQGMPDFLGLTGPYSVGASRIVVRTCAAPAAFDPDAASLDSCCNAADAARLASGANVALLLATGVGPMVLGESAWARVVAALAGASPSTSTPALAGAPLLLATWPTPISARWTVIPRLALVNMETNADNDPGACVELGRSRRIEWMERRQVDNPALAACVQPCDADTQSSTKAQNSAAYLEIGNGIPVAVISDDEPWLQGLRSDVRPEGPDLDGVLGAGALGPAHVEIDYRSNPHRLITSCDGAARADCFAAGRCPRLPDQSQTHVCFGLAAHALPQKCAPSQCPVQ